MNARITALFKEQVAPLELSRGYEALGRLGGWWLKPTALDQLARSVPKEAILKPGEFVVLLERRRQSSVIREGLALPLRWRVGGDSPDTRLPPCLSQLAEKLQRMIPEVASGSEAASPEHRRTLRLELGEGCPDLSEIGLGVDSAAAMLAATLEAARVGATIDGRVSATACLGETEFTAVTGLHAKLEAAEQLGIDRLFVARTQPLDGLAPGRIRPLVAHELRRQVHEIMLELDAPPVGGALEQRIDWYHRHARERGERAGEFFACALARELADGQRDACSRATAVADAAGSSSHADVLAVFASGRSESAVFAAHVHRPRTMLVLHEAGETGRAFAERLARHIGATGFGPRLEMHAIANASGDFRGFVESLTARLRAGGEATGAVMHVDLTGGTTLMKIGLSDAALRLGLRRFVVDQRDRAEGGTEVTTLRAIEIPPWGIVGSDAGVVPRDAEA